MGRDLNGFQRLGMTNEDHQWDQGDKIKNINVILLLGW